jgi:hypothetical protein
LAGIFAHFVGPTGVRRGAIGCEKISGLVKHLSQRRKGAKTRRRKENKAIILCGLCDLASLREIVYFFTPSSPLAPTRLVAASPCCVTFLRREDKGPRVRNPIPNNALALGVSTGTSNRYRRYTFNF